MIVVHMRPTGPELLTVVTTSASQAPSRLLEEIVDDGGLRLRRIVRYDGDAAGLATLLPKLAADERDVLVLVDDAGAAPRWLGWLLSPQVKGALRDLGGSGRRILLAVEGLDVGKLAPDRAGLVICESVRSAACELRWQSPEAEGAGDPASSEPADRLMREYRSLPNLLSLAVESWPEGEEP